MAKMKKAFSTRIAAILLSLALLMGMIPTSIIGSFALNGEKLGTVTVLSPEGTVANENGTDVKVNFGSDIDLTWSPADPTVGRMQDGWWVGIKMTAPADMTKEQHFDKVSYQSGVSLKDGTWSAEKNFWEVQDSDKTAEDTERYLTMWGRINEQFINDALFEDGKIRYAWRFDWDGDKTYEQQVTIEIDADGLKLKKDGKTVYPSTEGMGTVSSYTDGFKVVGDANGSYVEISCDKKFALNWVEKNAEIDRMQDGWWVGAKVSAPEILKTQADFEGVNYQSRTGTGWSDAKSFWQYKDSKNSDTQHFIGLWGLLNEEKLKSATETVRYRWRFDWNKDGVYEQIVVIKIDPETVTLKDNKGVQVYPELGSVSTITGGTVDIIGNKTGDVVVDVKDVTLNWSPKNPSIGRMEDGWWAGILITAPENIVLTETDDVKYDSKVGNGEWIENKSFYKNQDSAKDGSVHYMQLWIRLDRKLVADAKEAGEKVTAQWRFDWDKDQEKLREQLVTFKVDPEAVTLKRVDRTDFVFTETSEDVEVWVGDGEYTVEAKSVLTPGAVTYEIDKDKTTADATVDENGKVTFTSTGKVVVNATIAEDDVYNKDTKTFAFKVVKKPIDELAFAIKQPNEITYGENNNEFKNIAYAPVAKGEITYSIVKQESLEEKDADPAQKPVATIDNEGKLTINRSGKVTVKAVRAENDKYFIDEAEYTLTINKAEQTGFAFAENTPTELTYSTTAYSNVKAEGGQVANGKITYKITVGDDVAELDKDENIVTLQKGDFTLEATKAGDVCYNPATVTREMKVGVAPQTTFAFTYPNPENITWNDSNGNKFTNKAIDGESTGAVTYKVLSDPEIADFENSENPAELTVKKAGTVKVEATKEADNRYAEAKISYELTIEKANQTFDFKDGFEVIKNYGTTKYTNEIVCADNEAAPDKKGHGEGAFTYAIEKNDINATINETTGEISIGDSENKIGKTTVTVTRAEDERYNSCSNTYTFEIKYPTSPAEAPTLVGKKNDNGWYKQDVKIEAPEGYEISYTNELSTDDWDTDVDYTEEGVTKAEVYLKNTENGDITDKIVVPNIKIDKGIPTDLKIEYKTEFYDKIGEILFGIEDKDFSVTLSATDAVSGVDYVWYSLDNGTTYPENQRVQLVGDKYTFTIPAQYRDTIEFKAVDLAGNESLLKDDAVLVVDAIAPGVEVQYDYNGYHTIDDNVIYTNDEITVNFDLTADNFDLSEKPVIKVNGEEKTVTWTTNGTKHTASITLNVKANEFEDYIVTLDFADRLGRKANYTQEIEVDKTIPTYSVTYDNTNMIQEKNGEYYQEYRTATITVTDRDFRPQNVIFDVEAKDAKGTDVAEFEYSKLVSNTDWTKVDEVNWYAKVPFDKDANYTVSFDYVDIAGNKLANSAKEREVYNKKFTVDKTPVISDNMSISYSTNFVDKIASKIFFYNPNVTVTITATDFTAGVDYFNVSFEKDGLKEATNIELPEGLILNADGRVNAVKLGFMENTVVTANTENGKTSLSFEIPAQFRGKFKIDSVTDLSGNKSKNGLDKDEVVVTDTVSPDVTINYEYNTEETRMVMVEQDSGDKPVRNSVETANETTRFIYTGNITATITVEEANFYKDMVITVYKDGKAIENPVLSGWEQKENTAEYKNVVTLSGDGDYQIELSYSDKSANNMKWKAIGEYEGKSGDGDYKSNIHSIDTTAPKYSVTYDNNTKIQEKNGIEYYDANRTATIKVTDRNFRPNEVDFKVDAKDIKQLPVDYTVKDLTNLNNWSYNKDEHTWTATVSFKKDANYDVTFDYTDIAGHKMVNADTGEEEVYNKKFTVDKTAVVSDNMSITYRRNFIDEIASKIFFYNPNVTATITATDFTAGVDYFTISLDTDGLKQATDIELPNGLEIYADGTVRSGEAGFIENAVVTANTENGTTTISFDIPAQFRGKVKIDSVTDLSGNTSKKGLDKDEVVVTDTVSPDMKIEFSGSLKDKVDVDVEGKKPTRQTKKVADKDTRFIYDGDITATITVKEANFYEDMVITVYRDEEVVTDSEISEWVQTDDTYEFVKTIKLSEDGDYQIKLSYEDKSKNKMDIDASGEYAQKVFEEAGEYTSNIHTIDTVNPTYSITYNRNKVINTVNGRDYFDNNRTATVKVTDRNFRPNEVKFKVSAKDAVKANVTEFTYSKLTSLSDWKRNGDTWTAKVPFNVDANYTVDFSYTDIAGHKMVNADTAAEEVYNKKFTVDKTAPEELKIEYLKPNFVEKIFEKATFHFYKAPVKVRISAIDTVSGVYHFKYSYANGDGVSAVNAELIDKAVEAADITYKGNKASITFTIPEAALTNENQFRGRVMFTAYDRSENSTDIKDNKVTVVDNIAPEIDVTYTADNENTAIRYINKKNDDVEDFKSAKQAFYNGNVTAKISINEANFFEGKALADGVAHEVGILLTKTDNNGVETKVEYLPKGSAQLFAKETSVTKNITWKNKGDVRTFEIDYNSNADYVLTVKYVDLSENKANVKSNDGKVTVKTYKSKTITVDKIKPVIEVEYGNIDVKDTVDSREYFDKKQTATITVTEHNFRATDVAADIIAKNVVGEDVTVPDYASYLKDINNWKHYDNYGNANEDGNVHVANITYSTDANYTFDIAYGDLAQNNAKNYAADKFTVDKKRPTNLKVSYSEPKIWDTILESLTFGFYNAKVTVTITADDITSGVERFRYSYINSEGVSSVNAELLDQAVSKANITYEGKTAIATFSIPKLVLKGNNQFNGTVEFTAFDIAGNNNDKADEKRIVVDNIKPVGTLTFNEAINTSDGVSYYSGDIKGTIVITEANFDKDEVVLNVTRDGAEYVVEPEWSHDSVDVHTGTFTLSEEGDYIVKMTYADRSTNEMEPFTSNQLTIDKSHPTVSVSNVKNNSANKDETYGFTITLNDKNIDIGNSGLEVKLTADLRDKNGKYLKDEPIELGNLKTVKADETYTYVVENLPEDGIYTLTVSMTDKAKNTYNKIKLDDNREYENVTFSINRNGSTFTVDGKTAELLEKYYVYNVGDNVVIEEVNVDPIENFSVKLNDKVLQSGKDYTTTITSEDGEWSKRTYSINKSLFEKEGEYNVIVESKDKTQTTAFSDIKNLKVAFVVDQTAPVLTISGLKTGGRYQTEKQTVTVIPTDDGGQLNDFRVLLLDASGKKGKVLFEKTGEELIKYLEENEGKITFTIPEVFEKQIRITCNDCSSNADDMANTYDSSFEKVTVSPSGWILFYANKWFFYGSIAGVIALIGGVIFLIVYKKRKKNNA